MADPTERTDAGRRQLAREVTREMRKMKGLDVDEQATAEAPNTNETEKTTASLSSSTTTTSTTPGTVGAPPPGWSWSDYGSWPLSIKFLPAYIALLGIFIAVYYQNFVLDESLDMTSLDSCRGSFNFTFRINAARHQAEQLSTHSWEIGTAAEAITELVNPDKAVFAADPFPKGKIPPQGLHLDQAIIWAYQRVNWDQKTLFNDSFSVSDPAALGVTAIMTGQRWAKFLEAAQRQRDYVLGEAPRFANGAVSHRVEVAELWSDGVSMVPPFLAYLGVAEEDVGMLKEAVRQCELYRDVLRIESGKKKGLWKHVVGPSEKADEGAWSTGNAWAAYGMARVRATIAGWGPSNETMLEEIDKLDSWIGEILDGAIRTDDDKSGLLRNYLGDDSWFGETSGTALLAATAYRMAVFRPEIYGQPKYELWAHKKRQTVLESVDDDGFAYPAINPLEHTSQKPVYHSPEGESFLLILASAWRDCVCARVCTSEILTRY